MDEAEERFSIHIRAWGAGIILFGIGPTIILASEESPWFLLLLLLVGLVGWRNEKPPGGVEE